MRYPDIKICAAIGTLIASAFLQEIEREFKNRNLDSTNEASQKNEENENSAASELKDFTEENELKDFNAGV